MWNLEVSPFFSPDFSQICNSKHIPAGVTGRVNVTRFICNFWSSNNPINNVVLKEEFYFETYV